MTPNFRQSIRKIMYPVVRLMLRNGVDLAELVAELRGIYVDVATDVEFALEDATGRKRKITASRIAMLTGINRKEVKRIIEIGSEPIEPDKSNSNRAVRVLGGWLSDEKFCDKKGEPRDLSFGVKGDIASFETLVKEYSGDLTPRVILDELVRVGSISVVESGKVRLVEKGYVPTNSNEELLNIGSQAINDLTNTVAFNVNKLGSEKDLLQLSVAYDDISLQGVHMFRSIVNTDSTEFISKHNKILSTLDRSNNPEMGGEGRYRIGVGIYYFEDEINE